VGRPGGAPPPAAPTAAHCIARWDGSSWHAFGLGTSGFPVTTASALFALLDNDLLAGGFFKHSRGDGVVRRRCRGTALQGETTGCVPPRGCRPA
jgi:hypothetical protein